MDNHCSLIVKEIVTTTLKNPELKEVGITQLVSQQLKEKKVGLFQNEVDYRVIFPGFIPPANIPEVKQRLREDLVGFSDGKIVIAEFKIYDENLKNRNPWGVLYFFNRDRLKLEAVIKSNSQKMQGHALQICAVRNTNFEENKAQTNMLINGEYKNGRMPSIRGARFYPILESFVQTTKRLSSTNWHFSTINKSSHAFLISVAEFGD